MTIVEKWRLMLSSFADIKSAITEMGGTVGTGYASYAKGVRSIYSTSSYTPHYTYPDKNLIQGVYISNQIVFCANIKEEIRRAIIDGGVECGEDVPLSEYGNKIRQINALQIVTDAVIVVYDTPITAQLEATGGTPPYKWQTSFTVPGTVWSEDGIITGQTKASGVYYPRIQVTDSTGRKVKKKIQFRIKAK